MGSKVKPVAAVRNDLGKVIESLAGKSDAAFVLINAAYIEQCLGAMLLDFFIEETSDSMLKDPRFGGSLSGRTQLCYCLGFIPKSLKENIETIASIRNEFAHSHLDMDFSHENLKPKIAKLKFIPDSFEIEKTPHERWGMKKKFTISAATTVGHLLAIQKQIKRIKPLPSTELISPQDHKKA